mgnify:CR=1 FL=1
MDLAINLTFVGMTIVFIALIALTYVIYLFSMVLRKGKKDENADINSNTIVHQQKEAMLQESSNDMDENELVAVLTAAIAAIYDATGSGANFRVRSYRRISTNSPVWNLAGRSEHIAGKL